MDKTDPFVDDPFEPGQTYRIKTADGNIWMEHTNRHKVESYMKPGDTLQRIFYGPVPVEWRDE